ncbi:GNAT family N-acetyltransferase [Pseudomonas palleroniana]
MKPRKALQNDAAAIEALYRELLGNDSPFVSPRAVAQLEKNSTCALLVCQLGDVIVGTVLVQLCKDVMYGTQPFAVVENLVVADHCRGQGIGTALMRAVDQFSLASDCSKIMLLSSSLRTEAHDFFVRSGYRADAKRGFVRYRRDMRPASSD